MEITKQTNLTESRQKETAHKSQPTADQKGVSTLEPQFNECKVNK